MSSQLNNPLDNSDIPIKNTEKTITGGYFQSMEQAKEMKLYLENLKLLGALQGEDGDTELTVNVGKKANGQSATRKLKLKDMVPKESEFDRTRKVVISQLNGMTDDELRQWMARFGSDNIFHLSELITSYIIDKKKRDEAFKVFEVWTQASASTSKSTSSGSKSEIGSEE